MEALLSLHLLSICDFCNLQWAMVRSMNVGYVVGLKVRHKLGEFATEFGGGLGTKKSMQSIGFFQTRLLVLLVKLGVRPRRYEIG
jgi:hypothetical protein